ncbi:hypothetical protein SLA2020_277940 [Shorea laevis]
MGGFCRWVWPWRRRGVAAATQESGRGLRAAKSACALARPGHSVTNNQTDCWSGQVWSDQRPSLAALCWPDQAASHGRVASGQTTSLVTAKPPPSPRGQRQPPSYATPPPL